MKKFILTMLGAAIVAGPALHAQGLEGVGITPEKVNVKSLENAIAKSNAEIADAKKSVKAATWIKRGGAFYDAEAKPVNGIFAGLDEAMLKMSFGDATPEAVTLGDTAYSVYTYEHFKAYVKDGKVEFFVPTTIIAPDALDKAYEAYAKAYQIDAKTAKRVQEGMNNIRIKSVENASARYSLGEYKASAENFRRAYLASAHPTSGSIDTLSLYYAGMAGVWGADYENALKDLDKALELGYESGGETYRLKFLAMYNLGQKERSLEVLKKAVAIYPANADIIDMLMRYYAENEGDASGMIPMVKEAIANNPSNPYLYQGLAQIYDKLGRSDDAIETIKKAVELLPGDFYTNYLEGYFIVKKGDTMNEALNKMTITSREQYQGALAAVNGVFAEALPALERAHGIDPSQIVTVELLKNLTYRLRDDAAMNAKYEKYNALYNSMSDKK